MSVLIGTIKGVVSGRTSTCNTFGPLGRIRKLIMDQTYSLCKYMDMNTCLRNH